MGKQTGDQTKVFEKLGAFYLGRVHDAETGKTTSNLVLYDAKDLTTHTVCVGMTGSGKTGLCLGLLEEAAIDGIPAIAIDPKGDLGNLLLSFPDLPPPQIFAPGSTNARPHERACRRMTTLLPLLSSPPYARRRTPGSGRYWRR